MEFDKFDLIRRLEYKAHVVDNASWGINQLQHHIADINVKVSQAAANELDSLVEAIDEVGTINQIETATYNAEQLIRGLTDAAEATCTVDKQDMLWRLTSRIHLLDGISEWIRRVELKLAELKGETTDTLDNYVLAVEETDDIAVLQTAIENAERATIEHLQRQGD